MTDSGNDLSELSNILDDAGYYSLLLVYHSTKPDAWIKCANALNKKHKFKYKFNKHFQYTIQNAWIWCLWNG